MLASTSQPEGHAILGSITAFVLYPCMSLVMGNFICPNSMCLSNQSRPLRVPPGGGGGGGGGVQEDERNSTLFHSPAHAQAARIQHHQRCQRRLVHKHIRGSAWEGLQRHAGSLSNHLKQLQMSTFWFRFQAWTRKSNGRVPWMGQTTCQAWSA